MHNRKNIIGIEIHDTHIRIVQLNEKKSIVAFGDFSLEEGIVEKGILVNTAAFLQKCKEIVKHTKPVAVQKEFIQLQAYVSIPAIKVWSHTVPIPADVEEQAYATYVQAEAAKNIPVTMARLYTYQLLQEVSGARHAVFVGVEKKIVDAYTEVLTKAGMHVAFIGNEFYSIARSVLPTGLTKKNYALLHIGAHRTTFGTFNEHAIAYSTTQFLFGAAQLLNTSHENKNVQQKALTELVQDIAFFLDAFSENTNEQVLKLFITSEEAIPQSLLDTLQEKLGITVEIGDTYLHVDNTEIFDTSVHMSAFGAAIGLALYGVDHTLPHINLLPKQALPSVMKRTVLQGVRRYTKRVQTYLSKYTVALPEIPKRVYVLLLISLALLVFALTQ